MGQETVAGFRLSAQQERLWAQQQNAGADYFKSQCAILFEGDISPAKLRQAVRSTVARHEILRTVFVKQPGLKVPFQVILQQSEVGWHEHDLSEFSGETQNYEFNRLLHRERVARLDLEHGPILRSCLVTLSPHKSAFILTLPSLCGDRLGLRTLVEELARGYNAESGPDEAMQYADIVEWQRELLEGEEAQAARNFWRSYGREINWDDLSAEIADSREKGSSFAPEVFLTEVPRQVVSGLNTNKPAVSANDVLLATWNALLARLSGVHPVVGCAMGGRKYEELESAQGLLQTSLPIQAKFDAEASFKDVVRQIGRMRTDIEQWQESFAWNDVKEKSSVEGPDFTFIFEAVDARSSPVFGDVRTTSLSEYCCTERFTLKLVAVEGASGITLEFHYDSSRLSAETVAQLAGYFETLLAAAVEHPETRVSRLPLLNQRERRRVLEEWNQTAAPCPQVCLHELFEQQAERTPERPALRCGERLLSYRELNQAANQLAHHLRRQGVGPDSLVGLCVERSAEMIFALLGILKAGGAYVPLNPDNPKPRLAQQLKGVVALISEQAFQEQLPEFSGHLILLDCPQPAWKDEPASNPEITTTPENLVYVIYTSGSTGVPKGVAVRHRNLVNYTHFITQLLELERYPERLQFATVSTLAADLGNTCIYPALVSGGCLHVIPYEVGTDAQRLARYTAQFPIDVLKIVPSHLAALLDSSQARQVLPRRYLITGGETLTRTLVEKISSLSTGCELINHYGPTETTVGSLTLRLKDYDSQTSEAIPIGRPIANTQVYVLDTYQQPVPVGVVGELYIGGAGVTAGYLNQAETTAERFLTNPFANEPGARMYRTGDLARYRPDGTVEFLGRSDDQVKIRGFRIELGEIEAVLAQHAAVKQAVVLARAEGGGEKRLVAYVVARQELAGLGEELKKHVGQQLPDYMVPAAIVLLSKLPLTANGKIDRQALPAPEQVAAKSYVAPRTEVEQQVAAIWAEVLKRDRISVDDNFFELGGHSLLATQVISRVRRALNTDLPLRALFESPTVAKLSAEVQRNGSAAGPLPSITPVSRDQVLPLSFAQQRLWVLDQMEPDNPLYNIPRALRMKGQLNPGALEQALNEILRRHESQRTRFTVKNGEPVQVIAPTLTVSLPPEDLTGLPESSREAEAHRLARAEAEQPFDLAIGPLLRARLLRLAEDDHVLLITMHHIVSDAWSAGVFLQELSELYAAFAEGRPSPLPELAIQYADYAYWQRNWLKGDTLQAQISYWRGELKGALTVLNIPADRPRPVVRRYHGAYEAIPFDTELASALRQFSKAEDTTLFMTLLAGFYVLMGRYSGQEQVLIGTDVANRTSPELERLIGFFINLLPMRGDLSGNPNFRELLARVRESALGAYAHQEVPFEKLVEELQPERSASHNPLVQVLFVMQNTPRQKRELPGLSLSTFEIPLTRSKFDLAVFMSETDDGLVGNWLYSTELFERGTIQRMAGHFKNLLRAAIAQPDARVSSLEMLTAAEKEQRSTEKTERKKSQLEKLKSSEPKAVVLSATVSGKES